MSPNTPNPRKGTETFHLPYMLSILRARLRIPLIPARGRKRVLARMGRKVVPSAPNTPNPRKGTETLNFRAGLWSFPHSEYP